MLDTVNPPHASSNHLDRTAEIVAAYVSCNSLPAGELPNLLRTVHEALVSVASGGNAAPQPQPEALKPAVPIKKSVHDDFIVCLENGKRFKSLKRHLSTAYGLSPDQYRAKWGLPKDYPMVAPAYAQSRSSLARQMGLGRKRDETKTSPPEPDAASAVPTKSRRKRDVVG